MATHTEHHERQHHRGRRAEPEQVVLERLADDQGHHQVGVRPRRRAEHHDRDRVLVGGVDDAEQQLDRDQRPQQRQRDVAEAPHRPGAVDRGRLGELGRDRLQPREEDQHRERQPAPDRGDDDRPQRVGPAQPHRPVAEQPGVVDEDLVDDPDVALPHELPQQRDDEARHDPRRQHQRADHALAADRAVDERRDREPADERPADGEEGVDGGVPHRAEEAGPQRRVGVEERGVVVQPRRRRAEELREGEGVELLEAQVQAAERRQPVDEQHEQRGRRAQRQGEAPAGRRRAHPAPHARHRAGGEPDFVAALGHGRRAHALRLGPGQPVPWASSASASFCAPSSCFSICASLRVPPPACSRMLPKRALYACSIGPHCGIGE